MKIFDFFSYLSSLMRNDSPECSISKIGYLHDWKWTIAKNIVYYIFGACLSFFTGHFFFTGHYWTLPPPPPQCSQQPTYRIMDWSTVFNKYITNLEAMNGPCDLYVVHIYLFSTREQFILWTIEQICFLSSKFHQKIQYFSPRHHLVWDRLASPVGAGGI